MLQQMQQLQSLDMNDAQLAGLFQKLGQDKEEAPLRRRGMESEARMNESRAKSMETESGLAEKMLDSQITLNQLRGVGDVGQGLMMSNPELGEDVMAQILQRFGLYKPDPLSGDRRAAAKQGMTLEQYQQMRDRMLNQGKKEK